LIFILCRYYVVVKIGLKIKINMLLVLKLKALTMLNHELRCAKLAQQIRRERY